MEGKRTYYYNLVDDIGGGPYQGSFTGNLNLPPTTSVAHFREAVLKENSHLLGSLGVTSLGVFDEERAPLDGFQTLENMVAHAIFCSSRRNGVQGIAFHDFLSCLFGEFQDEEWKKMSELYVVHKETKHTMESFLREYSNSGMEMESNIESELGLSDMLIPFLAPPNPQWPLELLQAKEYGCYFGNLIRIMNEAECCIYVEDLL
ncbi:unnamed protein product, partial [Aphanomyces euteiches]